MRKEKKPYMILFFLNQISIQFTFLFNLFIKQFNVFIYICGILFYYYLCCIKVSESKNYYFEIIQWRSIKLHH